MIGRRAALAALGGSLAAPALAQPFPDRPIRLIVPLAAGGPTDAHGRVLAEIAGRLLGQPVVVENRPGASATLGAQMLATDTRADGHLVGLLPATVFRLPAMQRRPAFDPLRDFTYIIHLTGYTYYLAVRADSPWQDWAAFLAHAKANPGKVSYGTPGVGSSLHITMERIAAQHGIEWLHVPFRGGSDNFQALLGGQIQAVADSSGMAPLVEEGKFRLLNTWGAERTGRFPQVPTLRELGIDIVSNAPYGLAGPKGMAPAVVRALHDAFRTALFDPASLQALQRFDMPQLYLGPEEYDAFARRLFAEEGEAVRALGLRVD
ncbi:tripartite tricarboxylate transporter substrate binding protein [Roseicella aquatilis]|uniref:Tripartite tricarboxylate transporter substrate binding protein n=1 Tax=Roseicella aquatilis TaxID=2527868 RepID=A0A4R4DS98_9PROT|nr:tripartite tricarboxylate transporter substrate binding protein [Roseicella aquatilis]TCZ65469.1 tripartite tricarboxylate transporter substrate binding protein [Roseicella aquatilis]